MKYFLNILILCATSNIFYAQLPTDSSKTNSYTLYVGLNQVKEENIHPKVHSGTLTGFNYYRYAQNKNISSLGIDITFSRPKTAYEDLSTSVNITVDIDYTYAFKIKESATVIYTTGPKSFLSYNLTYYPNWDDSHLYQADQLSLGVQNMLIYKNSEKRSLKFDFNMSLLSFVSRPELNRDYKIDDLSFDGILSNMNSNVQFGSLNKVINISLLAEYQFHLTPVFSQAIFYQYNYSGIKSSIAKIFQTNLHVLGLKTYFK